MEKLVITNFEKRALTLPPVLDTGDIEEEKGKVLLPGENNVTAECWDKVKGNPGVKIWLRGGLLKRTGSGEAKNINYDWENITISRASEIISQVDSVENLLEIKSKAPKKGIREACAKRITELQNAAEKENA